MLYVVIIHAEDDRFSLAYSVARGLADETVKVIYQNHSLPPPVSEAEAAVDRLKSSLSEGLTECPQCIVLVSPRFLSMPWPAGALDELLQGQDLGRILIACVDVLPDEVARISQIMSEEAIFGTTGALDVVVERVREVIVGRQWQEYREPWRSGFDARILDVFGCSECESHPRLEMSCSILAPDGTSGLLACPVCGLGYWIREGVSQLLGDSAIYPDEPRRSFPKAVRRANDAV